MMPVDRYLPWPQPFHQHLNGVIRKVFHTLLDDSSRADKISIDRFVSSTDVLTKFPSALSGTRLFGEELQFLPYLNRLLASEGNPAENNRAWKT